MDSLIKELQRDALNPNVCVSDLLRKAFVAAKKLRLQGFEKWIELELNGYYHMEKREVKHPEERWSELPEYRWVKGELKLYNPYRGWQPGIIPNPQIAEKLLERPILDSIGEIESGNTGDSSLMMITYPDEMKLHIAKMFRIDLEPVCFVTKSQFHRIVESVRNIILQWALELEENGILGEGLTFTPKEKETAGNITYHIEQLIHQGPHSLIQQRTRGTEMELKISNSTVGVLNTGKIEKVRSITTNISALASSHQSQVAEALKNLTEAVAASQEISSEQQAEILEQLELLSEQATLVPTERKIGIIKPTLTALATTLSAVGGLAEVWSTWGIQIKAFFGLGG